MSKFKVGDKIRVKGNSDIREIRVIVGKNHYLSMCSNNEETSLVPWCKDELELVEDSKPKFKVGDKVSVIAAAEPKVIRTIVEQVQAGYFLSDPIDPSKHTALIWLDCELELVEDFKQSVEEMNLEELVECANRGFDAVATLYKNHNEEVVINDSPTPEYQKIGWSIPGGIANGNWRLRVKPTKTFEPYTIHSTDWDVEMDHSKVPEIHIGCKKFVAKDLQAALRALIEENASFSGNGSNLLRATKTGVRYVGHILPWSDAEELLKKLDDYLGEDK